MKTLPIMADSIFIGDMVVDVCGAIGVYCKAMSTGTVPMIEMRYPFSKQMECTLCIMGEKRKILYSTAKKMKINHIVLENDGTETCPATIGEELRELGFTVDTIDFTNGTPAALRQAGVIFNRHEMAEQRIKRYEKEYEEAIKALPHNLGLRVLVLLGLSHPNYNQSYLLVENTGGDADALIIEPTGCFSVGDTLSVETTNDFGITVIEDLSQLSKANPDFIALLGDSFIPQQALKKILTTEPAIAHIPAIANQRVFTLPDCSPGAPVGIPTVLKRWSEALRA